VQRIAAEQFRALPFRDEDKAQGSAKAEKEHHVAGGKNL